MNISYQWLRQYLPTDMSAEEVASALTSIGLEAGGVERIDSIPGGLRGLVIGEVLTCEPHENSDHLSVTTVSVGEGEPLQIVCGAPNVRAGVAVVVATIGTVLGQGEDAFTIKKSKIRGVESFGMLCAETEIGVGSDDSGIILLDPKEVRIGMPASEYYGVTTDEVIEVDITPNRVDATSHYGVARELAAYETQHRAPSQAKLPELKIARPEGACPVRFSTILSSEELPRYQGLVIRGIRVSESPEWLRFRLESIGLKPINNVVDITNYVLHEYGQPLHAYDLSKVEGGEIQVKYAGGGEPFRRLDHVEQALTAQDLIVATGAGYPLCLAGVMGSEASGTVGTTTEVFLESANFNPSLVRKTARRHGVNSDSSFRFERGLDASRTEWALLRATELILELIPGSYVDGGILDHYPRPLEGYEVELPLRQVTELIGKEIAPDEIERILTSLDIQVEERAQGGAVWRLRVPRYRVDVTRAVDVIEEILRIYGYNSVELSGYIHASLSSETEADRSYRRRLRISEQLVGAGFSEILNNSLSSASFYGGLQSYPEERLVRLVNPLSADLGVMRQSLLFGGLQSISRNLRRQQRSFYFFEWGNTYEFVAPEAGEPDMSAYREHLRLGLWIGGYKVQGSWAHANEEASPFELKAHVEHILTRLGVQAKNVKYAQTECDIFSGRCLEICTGSGKLIGRIGQVAPKLLKAQEIDLPIYFAELEWETLQAEAERGKLVARELTKYQGVKRDLSLLIDASVTMAEIEAVARKSEKKLLKGCTLFDVYEGKNLPEGKKSYAVSFFLQDEEKTMSEGQIEAIMKKIQTNLERELGASLR